MKSDLSGQNRNPTEGHGSETWIFQGNPDHYRIDDYFKDHSEVTWTINQKHHAPKMKVGQTVYIWRSRGKERAISGIIVECTIQQAPRTMLSLPYEERYSRLNEVDEPTLRVVLLVKRTFLESGKMLRKDTVIEDPLLKDLRILRMANETNYLVLPEQSRRIGELLGASVAIGRPSYADFGEAPNDDPAELRFFAAKVRRGQPKFRKNLLQLYGGKCAISGTEIDAVLEACHVSFHSLSGINNSANGILLRADIHTLFDEDLIRIDPDTLKVIVDHQVRDVEYRRYDGLMLPSRSDNSQIAREYLLNRAALKMNK